MRRRVLVLCAVLATTAGCGFLRDLAEDEPLPTIALSDETAVRLTGTTGGEVLVFDLA